MNLQQVSEIGQSEFVHFVMSGIMLVFSCGDMCGLSVTLKKRLRYIFEPLN